MTTSDKGTPGSMALTALPVCEEHQRWYCRECAEGKVLGVNQHPPVLTGQFRPEDDPHMWPEDTEAALRENR